MKTLIMLKSLWKSILLSQKSRTTFYFFEIIRDGKLGSDVKQNNSKLKTHKINERK